MDGWCVLFVILQICYFFYKNMAFGFTLFFYEAFASFSGQTAYNDWYLSFYNVLFTSLPVIALGVFDQDVSANFCLKVRSKFQFVWHLFFFNFVMFWICREWKNLVWWIIFGKTFENKPLLIKQQKGVSNSRKLFRLKKWIQHEHVPVHLFSKTVSDKCFANCFDLKVNSIDYCSSLFYIKRAYKMCYLAGCESSVGHSTVHLVLLASSSSASFLWSTKRSVKVGKLSA